MSSFCLGGILERGIVMFIQQCRSTQYHWYGHIESNEMENTCILCDSLGRNISVLCIFTLSSSWLCRRQRRREVMTLPYWKLITFTLNDILTPLGACSPCFFVLIPFPVLFPHSLLCPKAEQCDLAGDLRTSFSLAESLLTPDISDACLGYSNITFSEGSQPLLAFPSLLPTHF